MATNELTTTEAPETQKKDRSIPITGRFDQFRSSYWSGAIAALGLRYISKPFMRNNWDKENVGFMQKHAYSGIAGLIMQGVTGIYAYSTLKDIRSIFTEALSWEFNKPPEEVGFRDFMNSKNTIIHQTMHNYVKYNLRRFAINTAFFIPFIAKPFSKIFPSINRMHPETGGDLGVGLNALYLLSDIFTRKETAFESLQKLIDRKINHTDNFSETITANELLDVYERHAGRDLHEPMQPLRGTEQLDDAHKLFERMADLMNQTYKNTVPHEKAQFGFSRFTYLVGMHKLDIRELDRSFVFVEIANKYGVKAVDEADEKLKKGTKLCDIVKEYNVELPISIEGVAPATPSLQTKWQDKNPSQKSAYLPKGSFTELATPLGHEVAR